MLVVVFFLASVSSITYAAYSSILHQIFCYKLMVASWSISEEKYPQKNQGTAGRAFFSLIHWCLLQFLGKFAQSWAFLSKIV
jgi:hypothetical protein